jgi:hypothetical protein
MHGVLACVANQKNHYYLAVTDRANADVMMHM